jgi:hypothetical protein
LDWDLNAHRSTQQLIGRIGTSTRSTRTTSQGPLIGTVIVSFVNPYTPCSLLGSRRPLDIYF